MCVCGGGGGGAVMGILSEMGKWEGKDSDGDGWRCLE